MVVRRSLNNKILFFAVVSLAVSILLFMPLSTGSMWWRELFNSGHVILFAVIAYFLFFRLYATGRFSGVVTTGLVVLVTGMLLGLMIEGLQGVMHRESSVDDLYRDFFGIVGGLGLASVRCQKIRHNRIWLIIFSVAVLLSGISPLFQISWHYLQRNKAFPIIVQFDEGWSSSFVRFNKAALLGPVADPVGDENTELYRIRFDPAKYPGVSVLESEEGWIVYDRLHIKVFSDNKEDVDLTVRIHDKAHDQNYDDRFNQSYVVSPGINEISIDLMRVRKAPVGREMDMANIAGIQLFLTDLETSIILELGNIYLE